MQKRVWSIGSAAVCLLLLVVPVLAHHGDAGRYEEEVVTMTGTVVELQLINPHSIILLDIPDESGEMVRWQAELSGPASLSRNFGWTKNTLGPGDEITITGRRVKSGAPYVNLSEKARIMLGDREIYRSGVTSGAPPAPLPGQAEQSDY